MTVTIGNHVLGGGHPVYVIAEIGLNHNGDVELAKRLIDVAADAGANAVKFQHFNSHRLWGDARIAQYELSDGQMETLADYCRGLGIEFMCTPFGVREAIVLKPLVRRMKVASGCLERFDLLQAVRDTRLPVILSTGMSGIERIEAALSALGYQQPGIYKQPYTLLHCVSAYPCPPHAVNLAAMDVLRHRYGHRCAIGYSDHTAGIVIAIAAAARGATVIEKHLTLDRSQPGPDHKASIEPDAFRIMVGAIREVEQAIGDGVKRPQASEAEVMEAWYVD
jgi:sialic acid synthase SpsE